MVRRNACSEAIDEARNTIESLGSGLAQERAQTEVTKSQLQDAARAAVDQTRRQMDEMLAAQQQEIGRKTDEVIAQHTQQIEPILQNSAEKVFQHFSQELDQKLSPKLGEVQTAISNLSAAGQQAAQAQIGIREQLQQAFEQASQIQGSIRGKVQEVSDQAVRESLEKEDD